MPGTTATQNLTYPVSTDRLRDQGLYIETLAKQVETRLNSHDDDLARSQIPPFAMVERGPTGTLFGEDFAFPFERVLVDTDNMVDLSRDSQRIVLTRTGWWNVGCYITTGATGCSTGFINLWVDGTNTSGVPIPQHQKEHLIGFSSLVAEADVQANVLGCDVFSYLTVSGTGCSTSITLNYARMWAYWVRDL